MKNKQQKSQNPDDMDIVRSSYQTLDNRNAEEVLKENNEPQQPSAAQMLNKFRKKPHNESQIKQKSPIITKRVEVVKIQSQNSFVSKNDAASSNHDNQMSFVERIQ